MFKPGDEKYKNFSLLFNCLNGILFTSLLFLEVYRMWDFQYSRIRMRILHFNIRRYRMRIMYILLYWGYKNQFRSQINEMMKKTQKIMQLLN